MGKRFLYTHVTILEYLLDGIIQRTARDAIKAANESETGTLRDTHCTIRYVANSTKGKLLLFVRIVNGEFVYLFLHTHTHTKKRSKTEWECPCIRFHCGRESRVPASIDIKHDDVYYTYIRP